MKYFIVLFAVSLFMIGCTYSDSVPMENRDDNLMNFKIAQNGVISFYGDYPQYKSYIVADCSLDESLTWIFTVRNFSSEDNSDRNIPVKVLIDFVLKVDDFLSKHFYYKAPIGEIIFFSSDFGIVIPKSIWDSGNEESIQTWVRGQINFTFLRTHLWKKGVMLKMVNIVTRSEKRDVRISITRLDMEDLIYKNDGVVWWDK